MTTAHDVDMVNVTNSFTYLLSVADGLVSDIADLGLTAVSVMVARYSTGSQISIQVEGLRQPQTLVELVTALDCVGVTDRQYASNTEANGTLAAASDVKVCVYAGIAR